MSAGWVAGTVRARALVRRRIGTATARRVAAGVDLAAAVDVLADTPYRHGIHGGQNREEAEHGVGETLLWHLRVLAGWLPPDGVDALRVLAGWFELANVDEHVRRLTGRSAAPLYRPGALCTAWPRLSVTTSLEALRVAMAASAWGDPGAATPYALAVGPRLGWAERVRARIPEARRWAADAVALTVGREAAALPAPLGRRAYRMLTGAGHHPTEPSDPGVARQPWRAEAGWWSAVERDGFRMLSGARNGRSVVVGAVAVLATDAWRTRAALACAGRDGGAEVFDALS